MDNTARAQGRVIVHRGDGRTDGAAAAYRSGSRVMSTSVPRALWCELCVLAAGPQVDLCDDVALRAFVSMPPPCLESVDGVSRFADADALLAVSATVAFPACQLPLLALLSAGVCDAVAPARAERVVFASLAAGSCRRSSLLRLAVLFGVMWPERELCDRATIWFDHVPDVAFAAAAASVAMSGECLDATCGAGSEPPAVALACEAAAVVAATRAALTRVGW